MPQGDNTAANELANDAYQAAVRATGRTLTRQEARDVVSGQGYTSFQGLYDAYVEELENK
jgi:hypothetical protein